MASLFRHFYPEDGAALFASFTGGLRYNQKSLAHLKRQLEKIDSCDGVSQLLTDAQTADEGTARRTAYEALATAVCQGKALITCHTQALNVNKFYTVGEVELIMKEVFGALRLFLKEGGLQTLDLSDRVPQQDVCHDRRMLQRALGYILGKEGCTCDGMSGLVAEELRLSKREHSKRLKKLLAADKDVSVGRSLSYTVYAASWKGSSVAVKIWAANEDGSDLDAETFARLYTKVSAAASVNSPCITRPYRITWSGKIMMELGKCGMMSWYKRHRSWNLRLKLQLLCKAAMALMEAHDGGFVHCDIRAEKFIVFKEDPDNPENVELKISSLDLEDPEDITGGNVLPVTDEVAWVAPEVLVGKPLSVQSNVYSFGIVIHELISEAQPYGNVPREKILELKKEGHAPWALAENCPKELMTLISDCCSDTPLKRPTSVEIVCQRLTKLLHSYALPKTAPSKKTVKFEELLDAKYNKRIMGFLNQQLQKFQDLDSPLGATQETLSKLESAVKIGERLIDKHRKDVNIQTFYQSVEARTFTEVYVCNPLFDVAREWKMEDKLKVETKVPQAAVDKDREELSQMLEYVLMGNCAGDRDVPNEWKSCREGHLDRMQHLDEVDDEDVNEGVLVGEGGFSAVHECSWNGQRAAVKRLSNVVGKTKIECQADLLKDALIQGALWDEHVPKLIGISKSGWLLMELADGDLSTLCKQNRLKWPSQLGILLQAARRLRYMHSRDPRMVHCDVKSSNFLVFGTDPKTCTIKIADFGLSSAVTMTRCNTARRPEGTPLYVAPELYNNEVLSLASDVYSFGIVMYEVITGRVPFGGVHCNQHSIMKKKLDGVEPCVIEESDCPKDMHELMKECCKVDPQGRPKIADVCRRLTEMKQRYEGICEQEQPRSQGALYNVKIMQFLEAQLKKLGGLHKPAGATPNQVADFDKQLEMGRCMIVKHATCFDIRDFYSTRDACNAVQKICACLKELLQLWGWRGEIDFQDEIPREDIQDDEDLLLKLLNFVLKDIPCRVGQDLMCRWEDIQECHKESMKLVKVINEKELQMGDKVGNGHGAVYLATWGSVSVVVKKRWRWNAGQGGDLHIESFAEFIKEIIFHAGISDQPHIVKLLAVTTSGWMVMEQAYCSLRTLCLADNGLAWSPKVRLLREGSAGLAYLHSQGRMHQNIKLQNFLMFGTDPETDPLKISDFSVFDTEGVIQDNTLINMGRFNSDSLQYIAPEFFYGKSASFKSDVYAFGVLCYEFISGQKPYGGQGVNQYVIMRKKLYGEPPCQVHAKNCPPAALELMKKCCAIEPEARPTMEEVKNTWLRLPAEWVFEEHTAGETNETTSRQAVMTEQDGMVPTLQEEGRQERWVDRGTIDERASRMNTSLVLILPEDLRRTFESAEITHEAREGLLRHIAALTEALWEVLKRSAQNELGGCEGALEEMHNRLCSTWVEMCVLKERGLLSLSDASEDISCDLERVQVGISEAIHALQSVLHAPPQGSHTLGSSWYTDETSISILYNDMNSMISLSPEGTVTVGQGTAVDSSMEQGTPTDAKRHQEMPIDLKYFRYNRNCMEFLQSQMTEAKQAALPGHFTEVVKIDDRAEVEANAASYNKAFDHALKLGTTLTSRHAKAFDTQKFYTATEAREGVQAICKILKACVEWWNVEGVKILDRVPQDAVEEDEKTLDRYLGYILGTEEDSIFKGLPANIQKEWQQAKQDHSDRLRSLKIVQDKEIGQPQHHFSGSVYVATYRGREHAVKSGRRMDNVAFMRFYTEAAVLELIHSLSVARLFAVTRSGKLVMEKGEMDIMTWFWQHRSGGLKLKLRLLRDAAQSLNDVHYAGLVHRDIRTKKFVVFGGGQPEVKLVGFGKASTGNITGKNTVRKHGKITFAAPEIFEEKPCDMKSDIYSFGIVMYEMIGETLPYGRGATDAKVMLMKRNGEPPFDIPPGNCPPELLELMSECCAVDPADRPSSMAEVEQQLTMLVNLEDLRSTLCGSCTQ